MRRKCHNQEAQSSRGTKGRRDEEQISTPQTLHMKSQMDKEALQQRDRLGTVSKKTTRNEVGGGLN